MNSFILLAGVGGGGGVCVCVCALFFSSHVTLYPKFLNIYFIRTIKSNLHVQYLNLSICLLSLFGWLVGLLV